MDEIDSPTLKQAEMQRPMRVDARRNHERLLAVAQAAFADQGPDASLDDIARSAGVGIGTLYRHFPTRQALLEAVYRDNIEALTAEAEGLLSAASPDEALTTWLRSVLVHKVTERGLKEALMNGEGSEMVSSAKARMRAAGARLLARAQQTNVIRRDIDIMDLMRLAYGIALASENESDSIGHASRWFMIMLNGLRTSDNGR